MAPTMGKASPDSDGGHLAGVDVNLARRHGGRPATWHGRRFGPSAVNQLAALIIDEWRRSGDPAELAAWVRPIEDALGAQLGRTESARLRAALADAAEDDAEARYHECPCEEHARQLLRKRASDRMASLEHDREVAARHGLTL